MKRKIGITGANGYIGSNLVKFLLKKNDYDITALIHKNENNLINLNIKKVYGSLNDKKSLNVFTKGIDTIIHLASVQSTTENEEDFKNTIYNGSLNLIDSCSKNEVKKIINITTIRSLEDNKDTSIGTTEESMLALNEKVIPFDMWSAKADQLFLNHKANMDTVSLHLGAVIGPEDNIISPMGNFFISFLKDNLKMIPEGGYPWISIDDVLKITEKCLKKRPQFNRYIIAKEWISLP